MSDSTSQQHDEATATAAVTATFTSSIISTNKLMNDYELSWEPKMAERIYKEMKERQTATKTANRPYMVALVGIPGSGKTTSATIIQELLQNRFNQESKPSRPNQPNSDSTASKLHPSSVMVMPMDGYHLPLSTLKSKPNSKELVYKRGAPETFDPISLLHDLKRIRGGCGRDGYDGDGDIENNNAGDEDDILHIPGFDHAVGDPQPNAYTFQRNQHSIVICEGLYLLHQDKITDSDEYTNNTNDSNYVGWTEEIQNQFDLTIFINANIDTCIERLKIRNKCIPGYTPEEIDKRCDVVDRGNAMLVVESKQRAMVVVDSVVT